MLQVDSSYMKWLQFSLILIFSCDIYGQKLVQATSATLKVEDGYRIRSGDKIEVTVLKEPDCNIRQTVSSDGLIRLSYIGEIKAINMSAKKLEEIIKQEYIIKSRAEQEKLRKSLQVPADKPNAPSISKGSSQEWDFGKTPLSDLSENPSTNCPTAA